MNRFRYTTIVAMAAVALLSGSAVAGCNGLDGDELIDMLGEDAIQVEVNLTGAMLGLANSILDEEEELAGTELDGISVLIFDLSRLEGSGKEGRIENARSALSEMQSQLKRQGWERMARIREDDTDLVVMVESADEKKIGGLAVLGIDRDEGTAMFVNLCGSFDLDSLSDLGDSLDIDLGID